MILVNVDVPMQRWPYANWALIALTCLISFAVWAKQGSTESEIIHLATELHQANEEGNSTEANRIESILRDKFLSGALQPEHFSVTQLITYQFIHGDFWHLFGNMLFLFCFGNAINAKLGHIPFLAMYLGLGVFAGLGWLLIGTEAPLIGASGAISGINGVFLVLYPLNETSVHTPYSYWWTGDAWRMPSWVFIVAYLFFDLWGTVDRSGGVGYACHLAGSVVGIAVMSGLVLGGIVTSDRGEKNLMEVFGWVSEPERPVRKVQRKVPKKL